MYNCLLNVTPHSNSYNKHTFMSLDLDKKRIQEFAIDGVQIYNTPHTNTKLQVCKNKTKF